MRARHWRTRYAKFVKLSPQPRRNAQAEDDSPRAPLDACRSGNPGNRDLPCGAQPTGGPELPRSAATGSAAAPQFPSSGTSGMVPGTRRLMVGNYIISYRRRGSDVEILAVSHSRRLGDRRAVDPEPADAHRVGRSFFGIMMARPHAEGAPGISLGTGHAGAGRGSIGVTTPSAASMTSPASRHRSSRKRGARICTPGRRRP